MKGGDWNDKKGSKKDLEILDNSRVNKSLENPRGSEIKLVNGRDIKATTTQGTLPASKETVEEKKEKDKDKSNLNFSQSGINEKEEPESPKKL